MAARLRVERRRSRQRTRGALIAKLKGRSGRELCDRMVQLACAMAERRGFMPSAARRLPSGHSLTPVTPWPVVDPAAIRARLSERAHVELLARADRIVAGTFDVLGRHGLSYGSPVNWQRDPISERAATLVHWSRVPYLDYDQVGDHKVTWEVNRHQWLIMLGQAWQLTGDPCYGTAAARLLREWLVANPPKLGINWCSALELAFRVQSWIHGLRLFESAPELTPALRADLVASAALQIDHVVRNLSTWFSPNTHLTGEALAMLSAGCAWPGLPKARRWREQGWTILCEEAATQIRPDGVYFEQSAWYQSYTVDFYVLGIAWARQAGLPVPHDLTTRVRRAAAALRAVTRPDGTIASLGDDDGGRTLPLTTAPFGDMTDSLWRAASLLDDADLLPPVTTGRDALLWLEGPAAFDAMVSRTPAAAARRSSALRNGGWYTLVEKAELAERDHWLLLDGGPHGALSSAHSHADALSFDLSVHGVPLLIDAGTGQYVGPRRRGYRSTAAHNTVTVDGRDSSEQGTSFNWRSTTDAVLDGFGITYGVSFVSAFHDGYRRLADPVRHHRTILRFHRHYWLMFDTLDASASHHVALTLQAAPDVQIAQRTAQLFTMTAGHRATLAVALDPLLQAHIDNRQVSPAYALELEASALTAEAMIAGSVTLCTVLGASDEAAPLELKRVGTEPVWMVTHARGADFVACPTSGPVTLGPARFDGRALVLLGAEDPHTIVAAGAGTLHLCGGVHRLAADDVRLARCAPDGTWTMES